MLLVTHMGDRRRLLVQNFDKTPGQPGVFVIRQFDVDTERDADGVLYLVSDGIRYALAYGPEDRVCTLVNPSYIPCLSG